MGPHIVKGKARPEGFQRARCECQMVIMMLGEGKGKGKEGELAHGIRESREISDIGTD